MTPTTPRPTPETDVATFKILSSLQSGTEKVVYAEICAKLERERDEARRNAEVERLSGVAVVAMCKRQESEIEAMREAIKEAHALLKAMEAVVDAAKCIRHWHDAGTDGMIVSRGHVFKLWEALAALRENDQAQTALAKLQPFIKP